MKKRLKIDGIIIFCAFVVMMLFPSLFFRRDKITSLDQAAEMFGVALILLGQILRVSARGFKSENSLNGHSLIQGGPYSFVRNPMYLGIALIGLGVGLVLFNGVVLCIVLLVLLIRYMLLIFKEEKKLKEAFPREYISYQTRVPRLMPSMSSLLDRDISEYLPLKLVWFKKEIGPILAVLLITLFCETWEDVVNKGIAVYFKEVVLYLAIIVLFSGMVIYLARRRSEIERDAANKG